MRWLITKHNKQTYLIQLPWCLSLDNVRRLVLGTMMTAHNKDLCKRKGIKTLAAYMMTLVISGADSLSQWGNRNHPLKCLIFIITHASTAAGLMRPCWDLRLLSVNHVVKGYFFVLLLYHHFNSPFTVRPSEYMVTMFSSLWFSWIFSLCWEEARANTHQKAQNK